MNKKIAKWLKENRWLIAILILGIFLRIFELGKESFWLDEAETVFSTQKSPSYIISSTYTKVLAPEYFLYTKGGIMPFYFLVTYYWTKMMGLSEFKLRLFSAITGIVSIYLIYIIGKELFRKKVGLFSAFILSINHQHIYYSQEARTYSLLVLLAMLSVYFLYKMLSSQKLFNKIGYSISTSLMIYTHYYGLFILLFEGIYVLILIKTHRNYIKNIIMPWIIVFLAYLPWLPSLIKLALKGQGLNVIHGPLTISQLARLFVSISSWVSLDFDTRYSLVNSQFNHITLLGGLTIASVILISLLFYFLFLKEFLIFIMIIIKKKENIFKQKNYLFLVLWLIIPIFVPLIIAVLFPKSSAFGDIRYVLFATPAFYIIISKSIAGIKNLRINAFKIISIILLLSVMPIYSYYANYDKGQYREAAESLASRVREGEIVVVHGSPILLPFNYYYSRYPVKVEFFRSFSVDELKQFVDSKNEFWVVLSMLRQYDPKNLFVKYLDENFVVVEKKEFIDVKVIKYKRKIS